MLVALVDGLSLLVAAWALLLALPGEPPLLFNGLMTSRDPLNPAIIFLLIQTLLLLMRRSRPLYVHRLCAALRGVVTHAGPDGASSHKAPTVVMCIGTILSVAWVVNFTQRYEPRIEGDGLGHYAYVRSLLIDGDLDFTNEFRDYSGQSELPAQRTATGRVANPWPIGPAILWTPAFLMAHDAVATRGGVPRNGYSRPYHTAIVIASVSYGFLGLLCSFLCARRFVSKGGAFAAVAIVFWTTAALFYVAGDPAMPHSMSILSVGLALYAWVRWQTTTNRSAYFVIGAAVGLCVLIRFQDGVVAILPLWSLGTLPGHPWQKRLGLFLSLVGGIALVLLPQAWVFRQIYGAWMLVPQGGSFLHWSSPAVLELLFSWRHGFVSWTPIAVVLLASSVALAVRKPSHGVPILLFICAEIYLAASAEDWWGGAAFGARRLVSLTAPFSLTLAAMLAWSPLHTRIAVGIVSALLAMWNVVLVEGYRLAAIDDSDPVNVFAAAPRLLTARLANSPSVSEVIPISANDVNRLLLLFAVLLFWLALRRSDLEDQRT